MRKSTVALLSLLAASACLLHSGVAAAADFAFPFVAPSPITPTAQSVVIDTTGASGRARAFHVNGDWTAVAGDPFSNEFRAQLPGVTNVLGALDRAMGGIGNGNPFVFATPSNTTNPINSIPNGMLADIPGADLGGNITLALRHTFAGSSANLANASVIFYTDAMTPVPVALSAASPFMAQRPNGLASLSGAGQYRYQEVPFVASASGAHHLGLYTGGADGILLVYQTSFDPANPLTNLIGYNDVGSLGDANSSSMWLSLTAGTTYIAVPTTFASNAPMANGLQTVAGPAAVQSFTVGGTVSGLVGAGLVLQNSGGDDLAIAANGAFTFATPVANGGTYEVSVFTQPTGPTQTCVVVNNNGIISGANVTNVEVNCTTNSFTVGGTVVGLTGTGMVLQNNLGDNLPIAANGAFTFVAPVLSGNPYSVTVLTQPSGPSQTCMVSNGAGTVGDANVTNVLVNCSADSFTVGGTVTGLAGSGLVLQNNGGDNLAIGANGPFTFATPVASGSPYAVTVLTQPTNPWQTCVVTNGGGTMGGAAVTNVAVNCTTNTYTIGGNVSGLSGTGLVLQNNGGNNLAIAGNGAFTFTTPVASGATYNVTVLTQPSGPTQTCNVTAGGGTVAGANITNVQVTCTTNSYTIGGTVTGLAGTGLVLQNNGGNNLTIGANGPFTFGTALLSGSTYAVTVLTQPGGQICGVTNGAGTVGGANVTNVAVNCVTIVIGTSTNLLGFGTVGVNEIATGTITVSNPGTVPLVITGISTPDAPFTIVGNTCQPLPFTLNPGQECIITVQFQTNLFGAFESQIVITSSAAASPTTITLRGNTVASAIPSLDRFGLLLLLSVLLGIGMLRLQGQRH